MSSNVFMVAFKQDLPVRSGSVDKMAYSWRNNSIATQLLYMAINDFTNQQIIWYSSTSPGYPII